MNMKNSIKTLKNDKIEANILCIVGKEGDIYVALAPILKLSSNSKNSIQETKENLKEAIYWFFNHYKDKKSLNLELKRLGWINIESTNKNMPLINDQYESYIETIFID